MTCGKTLDGAYDIEADTLTVNESSDLKGFTTIETNINLKNYETNSTITISAEAAVEDYTIKLPSTQGSLGQALTTDGFGNISWTNSVSYFALVAPNGFMTVNGAASASTSRSATFNLELSGPLSPTFGGTGLTSIGTANQLLKSNQND